MDLLIGKNADPNGLYPNWFNGVIDEIRIYNRAIAWTGDYTID